MLARWGCVLFEGGLGLNVTLSAVGIAAGWGPRRGEGIEGLWLLAAGMVGRSDSSLEGNSVVVGSASGGWSLVVCG